MPSPPIDPDADLSEVVLQNRVPPDRAGATLVEFLTHRFPYLAAEDWRQRIAEGRVTVGEHVVTAEYRLHRGDVVAYRKAHREPPAPTDVTVLHDADGIVVVAKPAGLPFHADGAFLYRTLVGVLAARVGPGLRPVQRLDRETSGVCVLARSRKLAAALQAALADATKDYTALVRGRVEADELLCEGPIGRDPDSSVGIRRAVVAADRPDAQPARTEVLVTARAATASRLRCRIRTGRTHQIRVHLEHAGHPVLGDKLYGQTDASYLDWVRRAKAGEAEVASVDDLPRQMLHAARIAFAHPLDGSAVEFVAPLPADFRAAAQGLGLPDQD